MVLRFPDDWPIVALRTHNNCGLRSEFRLWTLSHTVALDNEKPDIPSTSPGDTYKSQESQTAHAGLGKGIAPYARTEEEGRDVKYSQSMPEAEQPPTTNAIHYTVRKDATRANVMT